MLGKKSFYRKPAVIIASVVILLLLNIVVVNNPAFAKRIVESETIEQVSEMTSQESNAQLAETADAIAAEQAALGQQIESLNQRVAALEGQNAVAQVAHQEEVQEMSTRDRLSEGLHNFWLLTGFRNCKLGNIIMILVGILFIFLAIRFEFEPMLLIPIGTGIIIGNIPFFEADGINLQTGLYQEGSVLNYLYFGVTKGIYPPLIFLGIGAMTDFSSLIANPKLMILGAAAQLGVFITFIGALYLGFSLREAGAIGIIGGADGPTAIFLSSRLANGLNGTKNLIGPIAIAAYSYMALVPVIQPPIIRLLTTKEERMIKMAAPRMVNKTEKIMFPIVGLILTTFISPTALPLLGMLFFGNIIKESGVVKRLQNTAANPLIDIVTIILGLTVGASTQASVFLTPESIKIFALGAASFCVATAGQPDDWCRWRFGRARQRPRRRSGRSEVRPVEPPAYARHGPECFGRYRLGSGSWCDDVVPDDVIRTLLILMSNHPPRFFGADGCFFLSKVFPHKATQISKWHPIPQPFMAKIQPFFTQLRKKTYLCSVKLYRNHSLC